MVENILFLKPGMLESAIIVSFTKQSKVYIEDARLFKSVESLFEEAELYLKDDSTTAIVVDAKLAKSQAASIRDITDKDVLLYKSKQFEMNVIDQSVWIKSNIVFRNTNSDTYNDFKRVFFEYSQGHPYNIAVDILSDVVRYYRVNNK